MFWSVTSGTAGSQWPTTSAIRRRRRHITSPEQVEHELQAGIDDVELGRIGVVLDQPAALQRQRLLDRQAQLGADVRRRSADRLLGIAEEARVLVDLLLE